MSQADLTMETHASRLTTGIPPFSVPAKKMAIWLFIIADAATFAACLLAYGFLRNGSANWPRPFHSMVNVSLMTFILLTSSLTMENESTRPLSKRLLSSLSSSISAGLPRPRSTRNVRSSR